MDPRQVEWFHKNLRLGKDWLVDDIVYRVTPMRVTVHVSFIGTKSARNAADHVPDTIPRNVNGGTSITGIPNATS